MALCDQSRSLRSADEDVHLHAQKTMYGGKHIARLLKAKGVELSATEQPINTGTAAGKAFLDMLGVFAEFETNLRKERQLEGIAKAKAAGIYKGRPPKIRASEVAKLKSEGLGATAIAECMGIGRASVYRLLDRPKATAE